MGINQKGKVWIIDEVERGGETKAPVEQKTIASPNPARFRSKEMKRVSDRPLKRILLTYLLGPFAPERWHRIWTPGSALGMLLLIIPLAANLLDPSDLARGSSLAQFFHWMAAVGLTMVLSGWSWALRAVGETLDHRRQTIIPAMLRRPGLAAFAGLWLPGFSLVLAGSPRRAALALWNIAPLAGALYILLQHPDRLTAGGIWIGYERLLIAALVVAIIAGLLWVSWALEGLRLQLNRTRTGGGPRGDHLAIWLMASMAIFLFSFHPVTTAEELHHEASVLADRGYTLLPLTLERVALSLDDSDPDYWLCVADYCEDLGRFQEAMHLRGKLRSHWQDMWDKLGTPLHDMKLAAAQQQDASLPETTDRQYI